MNLGHEAARSAREPSPLLFSSTVGWIFTLFGEMAFTSLLRLWSQSCFSFISSLSIYNVYNRGTSINCTAALLHVHILFAYIMRIYVASIVLGTVFAESQDTILTPKHPFSRSVQFRENIWLYSKCELRSSDHQVPVLSNYTELVVHWEVSWRRNKLYLKGTS